MRGDCCYIIGRPPINFRPGFYDPYADKPDPHPDSLQDDSYTYELDPEYENREGDDLDTI